VSYKICFEFAFRQSTKRRHSLVLMSICNEVQKLIHTKICDKLHLIWYKDYLLICAF